MFLFFRFFSIIVLNFFCLSGFAADKGRIIVPNAMVYRNPDFSSQVIGRVSRGQTYFMSQKPVGAFYKIKFKEGVYGFVPDTSISPMVDPVTAQSKQKANAKKESDEKKEKEPPKKRKSYDNARFVGFNFESVNFREDTMGLRPTGSIQFLGFRMSGPGVVMGLYGDINFSVSPMAPRYYEQATGVGASGFVVLIDSLLVNTGTQGPNDMSFLGFGPMFKYSKFNVGLKNGTKTDAFSLDDMAVGVVFDVGYGHRLGNISIRGDIKYYWEKMQYLSFGLCGQVDL